ncbi:MAG: HEAT repeat domain-containing protein, partial [Phycisphaerales bacterium]|nr:HEAT repeat domain-containing protein [Phycisphaerales bacterium]
YRDFVSEERDPVVRTFAIRALGRHGTVDDAPALAERLGDDNVYVRWAAAISLQRIHNPAVIPNMLATLGIPLEAPDVRESIAVGLGQYREDRVFQALVRALDDPELTVNYAARDALRLMTGQSFGDDRVDWLRWYEGAERRGTAFDGPGQYLYPTYRRKLGFFERLAFWSVPTFEYPATPIGLTPAGTRGTYDDSTGTDADARPNG